MKKLCLVSFLLLSLFLIGCLHSVNAQSWTNKDVWYNNVTAHNVSEFSNETWFTKDSWLNIVECEIETWTVKDSWYNNITSNDTGLYWSNKDSWFNYLFSESLTNKTWIVKDSWYNYIIVEVPAIWHVFDSWYNTLISIEDWTSEDYLFISSYNNHTISKYYTNFTYINSSVNQTDISSGILNIDQDDDYIYSISNDKITKYYKDNLSIQKEIINYTGNISGSYQIIQDFKTQEAINTSIWTGHTELFWYSEDIPYILFNYSGEVPTGINTRINYTYPITVCINAYDKTGKLIFGMLFQNNTKRISFYDAASGGFDPYISTVTGGSATNVNTVPKWTHTNFSWYNISFVNTSYVNFYENNTLIGGSPITSNIPNQLPIGILSYDTGNIYISEIGYIPPNTTANLSFTNLRDLTVSDNYIFITSIDTVYKFDKDLNLLAYNDSFTNLSDIENDNDYVYVINNGVSYNRIHKLSVNDLSESLNFICSVGNRTLFDLDIDNNYIYELHLSENDYHYNISKHTKEGILEIEMASHTLDVGQLVVTNFGATQIKVLDNSIYVSGVGTFVISKYDKNLNLENTSISYGWYVSSFDYSRGEIFVIGHEYIDRIKTYKSSNLSYINQSEILSIQGYKMVASSTSSLWTNIDIWNVYLSAYNYTTFDIWNVTIWTHGWVLFDYWSNYIENNFISGTLITDIIENVFLPFMIIFLPALLLNQDYGKGGFIVGLVIGIILAVVTLAFDIGLIILAIIGLSLLFMKVGLRNSGDSGNDE